MSKPLVISARSRWRFPFYADYIAVIDDETVTQRVKVMERFGGLYVVKCSEGLRVPELKQPVPSALRQAVPVEAVHETRR